MNKLNSLLFLISVLLISTSGMSQDSSTTIPGSTGNESETIKETVRGYIIQFKLDSALLWINYALPIVEPNSEVEAALYRYKGICYDYLEKDDSVSIFLNKALNYYESNNDYERISEIYVDYGGYYHYEMMLDSAIFYYLLAEKTNSEYGRKDPEISGSAFNNVALIKDAQNDHEVAEDYYLEAISCYKRMEDVARANLKINNTNANLIKCYRYQKKYDVALDYCDLVLTTALQNNDSLSFSTTLSSRSKLLYAIGDFRGSVDAALLGYEVGQKVNSPYLTPLIYDLVLGYRELELYDSSLHYNLMGLEQSMAVENHLHIASFHENLQYTYSELGDYEKAYEHLFEYTELMDKELSLEKFRAVEEMERQFRTEKQAGEIVQLTQKNEIQRLYVAILVIIILLTSALAYFISRKRQINHDLELAKQKGKISESVLQGQENERKRISIELHDSVGASVANVSMRLNELVENTEDPEIKKTLEKIYTDIDGTFGEIRRISHDLAPYKIEQEGLKCAIEELLDNLNSAQKTAFKNSLSIDESKIPLLQKSIIYRIVQELTTNICKHAKATMASVNMEHLNKTLVVQVNDNGIGYDNNAKPNGIGLNNVKTRIAYLNGNLEIVTEEGYGSLFTMEFPL